MKMYQALRRTRGKPWRLCLRPQGAALPSKWRRPLSPLGHLSRGARPRERAAPRGQGLGPQPRVSVRAPAWGRPGRSSRGARSGCSLSLPLGFSASPWPKQGAVTTAPGRGQQPPAEHPPRPGRGAAPLPAPRAAPPAFGGGSTSTPSPPGGAWSAGAGSSSAAHRTARPRARVHTTSTVCRERVGGMRGPAALQGQLTRRWV